MIEPFQRPINDAQLLAYLYNGIFRAVDTLKDKQIEARGHMPWQLIGRAYAELLSKAIDQ